MFRKYDTERICDMAAGQTPHLNDNESNVPDSVCDHEALQWLSIFKAIQSWGYDNLDKVQGTVKTLAHMLQEDKLAIKQKLRHCRLSPANNVADKLELGTTMRWSRQLAQTPSGQGEQALEQVKALTTEAVQDTMQDAASLP
jgi:hypothetical protein